MNTINDGGPAYPLDAQSAHEVAYQRSAGGPEYGALREAAMLGPSLRDHFAGLAMPQAWRIAMAANDNVALLDEVAVYAYRMADAMLRAREVRS